MNDVIWIHVKHKKLAHNGNWYTHLHDLVFELQKCSFKSRCWDRWTKAARCKLGKLNWCLRWFVSSQNTINDISANKSRCLLSHNLHLLPRHIWYDPSWVSLKYTFTSTGQSVDVDEINKHFTCMPPFR